MSASTRVARNASAQRVVFGSRSRLQSSVPSPAHTAYLRRHAQTLPSQIPAIAILVPRRGYATETSTSSGGGPAFPPPGFNAEEAKKPLPKEEMKKSTSSTEDQASKTVENMKEAVQVTASGATGVDKTVAQEKRTLSEMAADKAAAAKAEEKKLEEAGKKPKKMTIWQKVKHEAQHYWDGTKLLATEVRISSKLALKMAAGYELSRRENRQLQRTVQDLGRLVPFSVFVIVPFAELLLPVALKLFPNMLPSTYEGAVSREAKAARLRSARKEVSSFLRSTLRESGLPLDTLTTTKKEEFTAFFRKVRATGESPTQDEVISVCKLFKDDLTLDNLSRPQLVAMCRYMNLNTFGTDTILRYQIRHRMRQIKRDDKAISFEGVESLSVPELQMAAASRGLRTHGVSPARLRDDLSTWLDLRLKYGVPSTLLVLSNAYMYTQSGKESEISTQIEALQSVLSSIPEELFHEIELEVHNAEGAATNKQRLEVLREQQELLEEENQQNTSNEETGRETPKDKDNIDEKEDARKAKAKAKADAEAEEGGDVEAKEKDKGTEAAAEESKETAKAAESSTSEQAQEAVDSELDADASNEHSKRQKEADEEVEKGKKKQ